MSDAPDEVPTARSSSREPERGRPFVSLGVRLGLGVIAVVGVATAVGFAWISEREHQGMIRAKRTAAEMVSDLFAASLGAALDFGDRDAVDAEIGHLRRNPDVSFAVVHATGAAQPFASAGSVPGTSPGAAAETQVFADRIEVTRAVTGGSGEPVGMAIVGFSLAPENAAYVASRRQVLWLCLLLAAATMLVLGVVVRRQVVGPLDALARAARRIQRGERGVRVPIVRDDEIGRLARAFEAMEAAVTEHEAELRRAHESLRELFDNMRQAILVFDHEGVVGATQSRQSATLFGDTRLEGRRIGELLYPDAASWDAELRAFDEWRALAFSVTEAEWNDAAALAPPRVRLPGSRGERITSLEFRPLLVAGRVDRILLLATDETEKHLLAREVAEQGERHERQMAAMRRLVSGGAQQFVAFLESGRERLASVTRACAEPAVSLSTIVECFGHVHTLRGEARAFGLDTLAERAASLEERFGDLRGRAVTTRAPVPTDSGLNEEVAASRRALDDAERLFVEASPIGRAVLEQATVRRADRDRAYELMRASGGELAQVAERLVARSFGDIVAPLVEKTARWADAEQKRARVEVSGNDVLVPGGLARVLGGVLTHLVRNAIAHGIEATDERQALGKPPLACIRITAAASAGAELSPTLTVTDDGRGIEGNELLRGAADGTLPLSERRGGDGSFRVRPAEGGELSGRGMGLSAAVHDLEQVGFTLSVRRVEGGGARFVVARKGAGRTVAAP